MATKIWVCKHNRDQCEGRGPMVPVGHFVNKTDAHAARKGGGIMGIRDRDILDTTIEQVTVYDSLEQWAVDLSGSNERLRKYHEDVIREADPEYAEYLRLKEIYA